MPAKKATPTKATGRKATAAPVAVASPVRKATPAKKAVPNKAPKQFTGKYTLGVKGTTEALFDLTVPSGSTCQVRRPGIQGLIKAGILDSMDSLTALVQTEHIDRTNPNARKAADLKAIGEFAGKMDQVNKGLDLIDVLCCYVVVQPSLYVPSDYEDGGKLFGQDVPEDAVSVKDVDIVDRLYIMQWAVGGTSDLDAFRDEFGAMLVNVSSLQNISL